MGTITFDKDIVKKQEGSIGEWSVYLNGDLAHEERGYVISRDRLTEKDWILHLMSKNWFHFSDFMPAYFQALKNCDIKEVTIKVQY